MKILGISSALIAVAASLSGCVSLKGTEQPPAYASEPVSSYFVTEAVELIRANYLADSGTLSYIPGSDPDVSAIGRQVASQLRHDGYAVQIVLPPEKRQKGDAQNVEDMKLDGPAFAVELIPFTGSSLVQFAVTVGTSRFAKVYGVEGLTVREVSYWSRLDADESLIDLSDF